MAVGEDADDRAVGLSHVASWAPMFLMLAWCAVAFNPSTHALAVQSFNERREYTFTELATAFLFLAAAVVAFGLCYVNAARRKAPLQAVAFFIFGIFAFVVAMEETQWGQPILGYEIPEWMLSANQQREFTFHNLKGVQETQSEMYLVFCVAAFALYLPRIGIVPDWVWADVRAEPGLVPLLLCILGATLLKLVTERTETSHLVDRAARWTTEIAELYIAAWAMAYAVLKIRRLLPVGR